jgi:hypothetical protein
MAAVFINAVLGLVFLAAAVSKSLNFRSFVEYLTTPFQRLAPVVAASTIVAEVTLALLSILPAARPIWPFLAISAIMIFTLAYSFRLPLSDDRSCACWGKADVPEDESLPSRALAPLLLAMRNGLLIFACTLTIGYEAPASESRIAWRLLSISLPLIPVICGLSVASAKERRQVGLSWRHIYEPRWRAVASCWRLGTEQSAESISLNTLQITSRP